MGFWDPQNSPKDNARRHGDPADAAGLGPLGILVDAPAAAAQNHQVDGQDQEAQAQAHGADARQEDQRLEEEVGGGEVEAELSDDV